MQSRRFNRNTRGAEFEKNGDHLPSRECCAGRLRFLHGIVGRKHLHVCCVGDVRPMIFRCNLAPPNGLFLQSITYAESGQSEEHLSLWRPVF